MGAAAKINPEQVFEAASVVVFGRDGTKARGSWFPAELQARAHSAAEAMGMSALDVANDDVRRLATKLPQGRVFDSGKAFVPFVQGAVLEALAAHLPEGQSVRTRASAAGAEGGSASVKGGPIGVRHHPKDWSDIRVGSLVLACETEEDGYHPCVVQAIVDGLLKLSWRDYPGYPSISRPPERVALMWAPPTLADKN
jgi:hypothetical protein